MMVRIRVLQLNAMLINVIVYYISMSLLFYRSRVNIVNPYISDAVFYVGCQSVARDVFNGYLQDVRVYTQPLDYV